MSTTQLNLPIGCEVLLKKPQTAGRLGVTTRTIDRWDFENILPDDLKVKIGRTTRYRESVLNQWIADGCPVPSNEPIRCSEGECRQPARLYEWQDGIHAFCQVHAEGTPIGRDDEPELTSQPLPRPDGLANES